MAVVSKEGKERGRRRTEIENCVGKEKRQRKAILKPCSAQVKPYKAQRYQAKEISRFKSLSDK
jgi:hypothetical protein